MSEEKHKPVVEVEGGKIRVKVGKIEHPMEEDHYIMWIEVECCGKKEKKELKPGEKPEAEFKIERKGKLVAKSYCNKHGEWVTEIEL